MFLNNNYLIHNYGTLKAHEIKGMYFENFKRNEETIVDTNEVDHHKNIEIKGATDLEFTKSIIKKEILLNDDHVL